MELHIPVSENFSLFAGIAERKGDLMTIHSPEKTLFDQLCTWLDQRVGYNHWVFSIGATALCLRWGTYLAVLMDKTKPLDPRAKHVTTSMISEDEMKRINIEASSNLAHLLRQWHKDEDTYFDRLRRAYEWLPMPQRRVKRNFQAAEWLFSYLVNFHKTSQTDPLTPLTKPHRTLANTVIKLTYRNGAVEDIHAGRGALLSLTHRRFTDRQARKVIRQSAESLSPFVVDFPLWVDNVMQLPPWPERLACLPSSSLYPRDWSLTESSS
jgi:hypothetical protein